MMSDGATDWYKEGEEWGIIREIVAETTRHFTAYHLHQRHPDGAAGERCALFYARDAALRELFRREGWELYDGFDWDWDGGPVPRTKAYRRAGGPGQP